jgi:hypothetical protein
MGRGGTYVLVSRVCKVAGAVFAAGRGVAKGGAEGKLASADEWDGVDSAVESNGASGGRASLCIFGIGLFAAKVSRDFESIRLGIFAEIRLGGDEAEEARERTGNGPTIVRLAG